MSTSLRINIDNGFLAEIHDSDGDVIDFTVLNTSYLSFLDTCESFIQQYDCERLDSIWVDELLDVLDTYSDCTKHPNLWHLAEHA